MEVPTWSWIVVLCVFTEMPLITTAQVEHMKNFAINKTCNASSRYFEDSNYSGDCSAAINGILETHFNIKRSPPNCIHTAYDQSPFWWVDLGQSVSVHGITIYGRSETIQRMECVQVSLDGQHIYTFPCIGTANVTTAIDLHPPKHGRVVNITRNYTSSGEPAPFLNICEVQVWVCTTGFWGGDCQYSCSQWCQGSGEDNYCDSDTGTCFKGCMLGYWGANCTFTCGAGCNGGACNKSDGSCQCRPGWESPLCQNCADGYYDLSNDCKNTCREGCHDTCNRTDGMCQCRQNWKLPLCQDCFDGHYNVSNDCHNTCGEGCHDTCRATDGTCQCLPGWAPPMCQSCVPGYWGENCSRTCGAGCRDGTCFESNGTCQCRPGWNTPLCESCLDGHYNMSNDCQNTCGEGCHDTCNRTDGTCQCQPGWQPPLCRWCADGWFGSECTKCGHCANNSVCDKKTGVCPFCDGDFVAPLCLDAVTPCNDVKDSYSVAGPVAGAAVGAGIVFFIVGAIFGWWLRRSRSNQPSQTDYSHEGFSTKSNLGSPALSLRRLPERPGRPESPKDRSEDTSDYENIGFNSDVYEKSVVSDNEKTAYTPLHFHVNSENTDTSDYINANVRTKNAGRRKQSKF